MLAFATLLLLPVLAAAQEAVPIGMEFEQPSARLQGDCLAIIISVRFGAGRAGARIGRPAATTPAVVL